MPIIQRDLHAQLRADLLELNTRVAAVARPLDPEQLVRRPAPAAWSVGEVLEHLCMADELYCHRVATLIHRAHHDAGAAFREWKPSFLGKLMATGLARPAPMKAPKAFRPLGSPRNGVVEDFLARSARLGNRMNESSALDWRELRLSPPVIPLLKLNLGDVFNIHVIHLRRHLAQMDRVAGAVTAGR